MSAYLYIFGNIKMYFLLLSDHRWIRGGDGAVFLQVLAPGIVPHSFLGTRGPCEVCCGVGPGFGEGVISVPREKTST